MKVAYAFLFLMSNAASWVTGINLRLCSLKLQSLWSTTAACMRARCQADARLPPCSMIFPVGEPNTAYAKYFTGNSYLARVSTGQIPFANVTFEPGCRNNWHIHKAQKGGGQMLVGVAGRGWYQEEGKPAVEILPGTVIHIPANTKHWHGAADDSWFAHLAFEVPGEKTENVWLEPVSDEEYSRLK